MKNWYLYNDGNGTSVLLPRGDLAVLKRLEKLIDSGSYEEKVVNAISGIVTAISNQVMVVERSNTKNYRGYTSRDDRWYESIMDKYYSYIGNTKRNMPKYFDLFGKPTKRGRIEKPDTTNAFWYPTR